MKSEESTTPLLSERMDHRDDEELSQSSSTSAASSRNRSRGRRILPWSISTALFTLLVVQHYRPNHLKQTLSTMLQHTPFASATAHNSCDRDPYNLPGYIWRGQGDEIRWIPFPDGPSNASHITPDLLPPPTAFNRAAEPYNGMLKTDPTNPKLNFARNRTIVFVGDSHDRGNVASFCSQHADLKTEYSMPGGHLKSSCRLVDFNLTVASWFHYGMAEDEEEWYMRYEKGPWSIEQRLEELFLPDVANIGTPSVIVLNSVFWDLRYFALHAKHYNHSLPLQAEERSLTWSELEWHRKRIAVFVSVFRTAFPDATILFRLGQPHSTSRNSGNIGVFQLNESIRAEMGRLGVGIFEWARFLTGETEYADDQHLKVGKAGYLFSSMSLFYLWRHVVGC